MFHEELPQVKIRTLDKIPLQAFNFGYSFVSPGTMFSEIVS